MVAFRDKLARLSLPQRHPAAPGDPAAGEFAADLPADVIITDLPVEERLRVLRQVLGRMLDAPDGCSSELLSPTLERAQRRDSFASLAFERRDTPWGKLDIRELSRGVDERVGRLCLGELLRADMEQLALLGHAPELIGSSAAGALFLDTESTGFGSGTGNYAFLVGACRYRPSERAFVLEQVLLRNPDDEPRMLDWLSARIEQADYLVSYNGKSFDLPLIRGRAVMCRRPPPAARPQLDLLHTARRVHRLQSYRKTLGVLERRALGFERGPDVSGAEVAERYLRYLHHRCDDALTDLVAHNAHDVLSLIALMALYGGPIKALDDDEIVGVAHTLWQQRAFERARYAVDLALDSEADHAEALRVSAFLHKAQGDKRAAIADFEQLALSGDEQARLELAKLYEHFLCDIEKAINVAQLGTGEENLMQIHRLARLQRKRSRAAPLLPLTPRHGASPPADRHLHPTRG